MRSEVAYGAISVPVAQRLEALGDVAPGEERAADRRRDAEQEQDQPAEAAVVPQQREIGIVDEGLAAQLRRR